MSRERCPGNPLPSGRGAVNVKRRKCPHPETWAEDGTPSARLWCGICGEVLIQPPGWEPAVPPRVCWIRREIRLTEPFDVRLTDYH